MSLSTPARQLRARPEPAPDGGGAPPALPALPPALKASHQGPVDYAIVEPERMPTWVDEVETRLSQLEDDHDR